ncbi:hypothetical protein ACFFOM_15280 [Microlunatus capsulatus]|uniref:Heme exporter protein D n=1 Tax=Microlunatus capsulatus TaxID=99117 RepID=A0ABS4Z775_9ACTN|nr:hypothetical protein [Microlunatus capsulatus]MBP2416888.1 heme exporter protein D [Microlunatus capsulatus]
MTSDPSLPVVLAPRWGVVVALAVAAVLGAVAVLGILRQALDVVEGRGLYVFAAVGVGLVVLVAPLVLLRVISRTRVHVGADAVERRAGDRVLARLRFDEAREIRVRWQVSPGVMGRRPVVALLGPAGGVRGIVVNGLLVADLDPLLDRVAVEVGWRPAVLTSDWAVYDEVMASRSSH